MLAAQTVPETIDQTKARIAATLEFKRKIGVMREGRKNLDQMIIAQRKLKTHSKMVAAKYRAEERAYLAKALTYAVPEVGPERDRIQADIRLNFNMMMGAVVNKARLGKDARHLHLAFMLVRGKEYKLAERTCVIPPNANEIAHICRQFDFNVMPGEAEKWLKGEFRVARPVPAVAA